ncbi:MAG: Uma2 family endonuclease [Bacteroidales bacterium]|jgi:Uma2 family endonuclease|nr:Uma2 family endonuclease [Bacteroidales bacterium]
MEVVPDLNRRYTYADYLTWADDKMRELLNGVIRVMSPAPTLQHAVIVRRMGYEMIHFVKKNGGDCQVFFAPFDVRLPRTAGETAPHEVYTVVQPDICVVCDRSKLDKRGCLGAPDMVAEILSPASLKYDLNEKFNLYEAGGVKEYWVVDPAGKSVHIFVMQENGKFDNGTIIDEDSERIIPVRTLKGLSLDADMLFADV